MKPLGRRILIKKPPVSEMIGSIVIPERARSLPQEGTVVAIGPKVTDISVGDQVLFGKFNTTSLPGSDDLVFVWEPDVVAVLT